MQSNNMATLPRLQDAAGELSGKRVLIRADFNVPLQNGILIDTTRVTKTLETIRWLKEQHAKIGIISHIESEGKTLEPIAKFLSTLFPVRFAKTIEGFGQALAAVKPEEVVLLENLRHFQGEKENDAAFAQSLAATADVYVNDAFSVSHREHASVVGVAQHLPHYAGLLFQHEYEALSQALTPTLPFVFILGGAKFETKVPLIEKFLNSASYVFVGGALAHNFFRAKGLEIGKSLVSPGSYNELELLNNKRLLLPVDVVAVDDQGEQRLTVPHAVEAHEFIADNGPETVAMLANYAKDARLVVWNGPLGAYERGYKENTLKLAQGISESSATTILGGGDTIAAIKELNIENKFTHVSTAGGAMLEFLEKGTLPGIEALQS
jgi:phosphoglycerate kinase